MKTIKVLVTLISQLLLCMGATAQLGTVPTNLCLSWFNQDCFGRDDALLSTGLTLNYTCRYSSTIDNGETLESYSDLIPVPFDTNQLAINYPCVQQGNVIGVEYFFLQPEHGGGRCHCANMVFADDCSNQTYPSNNSFRCV